MVFPTARLYNKSIREIQEGRQQMKTIEELLAMARENTVSYHNTGVDRYFFGNSIVGASGLSDGTWTFVIGPDYTSPNFITGEKIYLLYDGKRVEFDLGMKRIRGTGVFFGEAEKEQFRLSVFDFAPPEKQMLIRLITAEDLALSERRIRICAEVTPFEGMAEKNREGILIRKDTECFCFGNRETKNWENRCCQVGFLQGTDIQVSSDKEEDAVSSCLLAAEEGRFQALIHKNDYESDRENAKVQPPLEWEEAVSLLSETFHWWKEWFRKGKLPDIPHQRDADALESLLLSVKMQQNRDGGEIAGIYKYANSYVRDTHGCSRLYNASGHYEESKRIILNIHTRWERAGFIPNWWSMGSDTFIGHSFHNDVSEITAYYMFMIRDYLNATGDKELLETVRPSLDYAAESQLAWLKEHDFTMDFNGDETEQYCCNQDGEEYGGFVKPGYEWNAGALSFPSMTAALCSLEWYSSITGKDLKEEMGKLRDKIDQVFCDRKRGGVHAWAAVKKEDGYQLHAGQLTNYLLFPLWIGARLKEKREAADALAVKDFVMENGFLPNCPQAMQGFCGHTMGMYLDVLVKLGDREAAQKAARQILDSPLLSMYGTVSEFYGPSCTPNGHMCRGFEGGITGQALIDYFRQA